MLNRRRWIGSAAAMLAILTLCAREPLAAQGIFAERDAEFSFGGVHFPSVVDTFAVLQVTRYPQSELGVALRYATPADPTARIDLYVYPISPSESAGDTARAEFERTLDGIREMAEQNPGRFEWALEAVDSVTVGAATESYSGWRAEASAREGGVAQRSLAYVFVKGSNYIKYRIAYATNLEEQMRARIDDFVEETLGRVRTTIP